MSGGCSHAGIPHEKEPSYGAQDGGHLTSEQSPVRDHSAQETGLQQKCELGFSWWGLGGGEGG